MTGITSSKPSPRRLPKGFKRFLRFEDHWALFSVTLTPDRSGMGWAYVWGLVDLTGRPDGWKHLLEEWRRLERWCWHDGVLGWYCLCDLQNVRMQRWLKAVGAASQGMIEGQGIVYYKKLLTDPEEHWAQLSRRSLARTIVHGRSGHA